MKQALLAAAVLVITMALTGCAPGEKTAAAPSPGQIEAQIRTVQGDPSIPPQAKAAVLARLESQRKAAKR